jgi:hypothetical protein
MEPMKKELPREKIIAIFSNINMIHGFHNNLIMKNLRESSELPPEQQNFGAQFIKWVNFKFHFFN